MGQEITPLLVLLMWNLLFTGEEPMVSKAKPGVDKKKVQPLVDAGLIVLEKRGRANHLVLTDRAWQWAEENLDAEFSPRANATPALQGLLPRLKNYLAQSGTPLAELLTAADPATPDPSPDPPATAPVPEVAAPSVSIEEAIAQVYLALTGGQWETRVRLSDLRDKLAVYSRDALDGTLRGMQQAGRLVLYRNDDPQDMSDADHAAALYIGSDPRHLVYMKG